MDVGAISDDPRSLAEHRVRCKIYLPVRFQDEQPQVQAALPPPETLLPEVMHFEPVEPISGTTMKIRKLLTSSHNVFGLFQKYRAEGFPTHDPEVEQQHAALSKVTSDHKELLAGGAIFGPYPNKSTFLLGEWYWNDGMQKKKAGFKWLIDIICQCDFRPEDIQSVPWDALNMQLAIWRTHGMMNLMLAGLQHRSLYPSQSTTWQRAQEFKNIISPHSIIAVSY